VTAVVETHDLTVRYSGAIALDGVDLTVREHEMVALIGANGAGKSTLVKALSGLLRPAAGTITVRGRLAQVPEGREMFGDLTVDDNLRLGGWRNGRHGRDTTPVYDLLPELTAVRHRKAGALSGGQQQMVAIGRALMSNPKLLLCDEISLGLAPIVVREVYARLPSIVAEGSSLIIVEQDIVQALKAASQVYCLQEGRVALTGSAGTLTREAISAAYFGA
jgi:branched-chain amino acid transport system ATP-binding protein